MLAQLTLPLLACNLIEHFGKGKEILCAAAQYLDGIHEQTIVEMMIGSHNFEPLVLRYRTYLIR